ncbi:3-oxoacyl-ACP synthase III family protein [Streptomyces cyanogenus]|uniref:3-oxoacyl-[acyl-carrier-protein] synthase 3 protein 1 n=1 Tax=Streptomyces cyanogenus TaxID=80860 RepID=A0ABX7TPA5_STRCY|nr:3-oxoacyl-ACP synthase III family protein [Streptomyces cyanogenus]QTD96704.1 3-oxoacyl-[acyl-carrier-protein] synthase 3 protein 1 [Streptomyces cyanogenus]
MDAPDIHIRSVGTALPGPAIDNAALRRRFGMPSLWEQWIDEFVGTHRRHLAVDLESGEVRHSLADLGELAGRRALDGARLDPRDVDLVVMGTSSPDLLMPATVNEIADRLGIDQVPSYQLQSGCTGAVQALDVASQMLRSGRRRTALVLGGDTCAKHFDVTMDVASLRPEEQINGVLFGDGAGAVVLSTEPAAGSAVLKHVFVRLVGRNRPPGQIVEWFGRADRGTGRPPVVEDYKAIEHSVPLLAAEAFEELLGELDWKNDELEYLMPPQLSGRMTARITKGLSAPAAQEISLVAEIGNTGNALPFFQLEAALPRMAAGERAAAVAVESSKWIKAGFGLEKV